MLPTFGFSESFYIGYQIGFVSRGGIIAGYKIDSLTSVEMHLGGGPHFLTYGISLKQKFGNDNDNYFLLGYTKVGQYSGTESFTNHGLNLGVGFIFRDKKNEKLSYPIEIGGGPGYDLTRSRFTPNFFAGYGVLYGDI